MAGDHVLIRSAASLAISITPIFFSAVGPLFEVRERKVLREKSLVTLNQIISQCTAMNNSLPTFSYKMQMNICAKAGSQLPPSKEQDTANGQS